MARARFVLDNAGLIELCRSPEMQGMLLATARRMADRANAAADGHAKALHITKFDKPPYAADVDVLDRTAVGVVHPNTTMGIKDQAKFKTLSSQNH